MERGLKENSHETPLTGGTVAADGHAAMQSVDPTIKCRIEQAERTIKKMTQKRREILKTIEDRKSEQRCLIEKLKRGDVRVLSFNSNVVWKKERLDTLKLALDKLSFANKAYQDKAVKSCILEEEINFRNLHCGLLHQSNSLAAEKRLLQETKRRQQKGSINQFSKMDILYYTISGLISQTYMQRYDNHTCRSYFDEVTHKRCLEEVKPLKSKREKAIANAAVKGSIWNSLGSKEKIKQEMNVAEKELKECMDEHLSLRSKITNAKKELKAIEKEISTLQKQCIATNKRKGQAYQHIIRLTREQEAKFQSYIPCRSR